MNQATSSTATTASKVVASAPPFTISPVKKGDRHLKILVYGKHGVGKTTLAGSAADVDAMNDVLLINVESGDMVFDDNDRIENPDRLLEVEINSFKQAAKVYEYLTSHISLWKRVDAGDEEAKQKLTNYQAMLTGEPADEIEKLYRFKTVIVDSLTELQAYCMYGLLGLDGAFDLGKIDDDMKTAEFAEYKKNNNMVNLLVRAFRDLPMHVIILCGSSYTQDEQKKFHYTPDLTGKLSTQVQGYFDIVGYLVSGAPNDKGIAQRRLYVQPVGKWDAKNRRSSYKEAFFDDPTMRSILKSVGLLQT